MIREVFAIEIESFETDVADGIYKAKCFCSCCASSDTYYARSKIIVDDGEIDNRSVIDAANEMATHYDRNIYLEDIKFENDVFRLCFGS